MNTWVEITKQMFDYMASSDKMELSSIHEGEGFNAYYYSLHGTKVLVQENFVPMVAQYYIQDINA